MPHPEPSPTGGPSPANLLADARALPADPGRSRLGPHVEVVRELRRKGLSWRAVAAWLRERGVDATATNLHAVMQRREGAMKGARAPKAPARRAPARTTSTPDRHPEAPPPAASLAEAPDGRGGAVPTPPAGPGRPPYVPPSRVRRGLDLRTRDQMEDAEEDATP